MTMDRKHRSKAKFNDIVEDSQHATETEYPEIPFRHPKERKFKVLRGSKLVSTILDENQDVQLSSYFLN